LTNGIGQFKFLCKKLENIILLKTHAHVMQCQY